jgi:hypothetical protein
LLDPNGHGKTYDDAKNLYKSIKDGATFEAAFQNHFDMTVSNYQSNFFKLTSSKK